METKYDNSDLRRLQLTMLEMLKVFDAFCKEHNLKYSLYGGTMIGAVRHHGFIPWDDDLDVCMEREDYERFLKLWNENPPKGYFLQNKESEEAFTQTFTKIRKNGTTFLQFESERGKIHTGIFIDVFPHDRIPSSGIKRWIYQYRTMKYELYTREFTPPKASLFVKIISALLLLITSHNQRMKTRAKLLNKLTAYDSDKSLEVSSTSCLGGVIRPFPPSFWNGNCVLMSFEDAQFPCAPGWDDALQHEFGDYMQLPPEESRLWKHHPIVLDFEKGI